MKHCLTATFLFGSILIFGMPSAAQNAAGVVTPVRSQPPSSSAQHTTHVSAPASQVSQPEEPDEQTFLDEQPRSPQPLGKAFWIAWGLAIGASVADNELTAHCLQLPNCKENNPLLGPHPSRLKMYGIKAGIDGAGFIFSFKWRREDYPRDNDWLVLPAGLTAIFGVTDIANTFVYERDLRTAGRPASRTTVQTLSLSSIPRLKIMWRLNRVPTHFAPVATGGNIGGLGGGAINVVPKTIPKGSK